ncbi:MAG: cytidine deaminase [Clostridia bacterium]|nr:cytidine deaminase [Clostridia bacterium]
MSNEELINLAKEARKNAYVSYTNYSVGAALLASSNRVYIGCNIEENTIPGLSNCAERVAVQNAISNGERDFLKIAVVGGATSSDKLDENIAPCGVCLQYMLDMCKGIKIVLEKNGEVIEKKLIDFLNTPFELKNK